MWVLPYLLWGVSRYAPFFLDMPGRWAYEEARHVMAQERLSLEEVWAAFQLLDRREDGCVRTIAEAMGKCDRAWFDSLVQTFPNEVPWAFESGRKEHELCALTLAAALIALRDRPELLVALAVVAEFLMEGKDLNLLIDGEGKSTGGRG